MFGSGHGSGHTRHNGHSHGNHHHGSKSSKSKSQGAALVSGVNLYSFLFVINEFVVNYEPLEGQDRPLRDPWLNIIPPQDAAAYTDELVGTVFRYQNGHVSPAQGYFWHRPAMGHKGYIVRLDPDGSVTGYPGEYKAQTVFACSSLLPMIVTNSDASLGSASMWQTQACAACSPQYQNQEYTRWWHLHFTQGDSQGSGISSVNSVASGCPYVVGKDAAWIPSLVPSAYRNTSVNAVPSTGLSGDLPIILALMGFHGALGRASDVFHHQKWSMGRWNGGGRASSYLPRSGESPRGLFVQVCADNLVEGLQDCEENNLPEAVWNQMLRELECCTILVQG
ncbi:uncharacterized protein C8A04DRAFT_40894 [Dichotomopilus funicola]|uniref:Uncharacterized protein n=1 Tax=Dichotomopilus funicola TaxID=1934379 RepID=A0AAN6UU17_9PEZI|nr:hypothetical protein C8A04DRAFT_40894 [Dichotomopilus funicola]